MAGRIICFISLLMCAIPFWAIAKYGKDSKDPISFWSGDATLKEKVKDIAAYNREMAVVYHKYGWAFFAAAVGGAVFPMVGIGIMALDATVGLWLVYRTYKKILQKYA